MWNSRRAAAAQHDAVAHTGRVTTGGGYIHVHTDMERRAPVIAVPYGMAVCVPQGENVLMLPESGVCLGCINDAEGMEPGEVRLFSAGGAEICLKADGTVTINGQVFPKNGGDA